MRRRATEVLAELGIALDPRLAVKHLSVADQQMVEIAKALIGEVKLLILDEPTAVISGREAELLFERMRRLRDRGAAIIYISHRLEEVFKVADRVTVLKDGRRVGTWPATRSTARASSPAWSGVSWPTSIRPRPARSSAAARSSRSKD